MNRRRFLRSSTAAVTATLLRTRSAAAALRLPPAIDTHIHIYDPARPAGVPWPQPSDSLLYRPHLPAEFRALAAPVKVAGAVIVEASPWIEDNQWVLDRARDDLIIVGVVGRLQPGQPGFAGALRRFAADPLFRGLRLHPADLPVAAADLRQVAEAGLAVEVFSGAAILAPALDLAKKLPSLTLIIDHLPFRDWDGDVTALRAALKDLAARDNIWIKISDVVRLQDGRPVTDPAAYRPALDTLLDLFGPDRVMFGSNWPVSNRVAPYATIHGVAADYFQRRDPVVAEKFFWRNSYAAYRWQPRGAAAALVK